MFSRATVLRQCRFTANICASYRTASRAIPSPIQSRGVRIRKVLSDEGLVDPTERDLERSYHLLLAETELDIKDLQGTAGSAAAEPDAQAGQVDTSEDSQTTKWDLFKQKYNYPEATHSIRELENAATGQTVVVHGYVSNPRVLRNMVFVNLFDNPSAKAVQLFVYANAQSSREMLAVQAKLSKIKPYTPVAIVGKIREKESQKDKGKDETKPDTVQEYSKSTRRELEIAPEEVYILNGISEDLMFTRDSTFTMSERHLQLRTDRRLQQALRTRAQVASICRSELEKQGFLEVETPLLFKSTPEGAREFLVPTRQQGLMYALPQSPQQYKQILMASGVQKYFQFAKCFRDEDLRADRQPEFTQLDLEMSFSGSNEVMRVIGGLVKRIWKEKLGTWINRIPRLTYDSAMRTYGSDKPDLRYSHSRIRDITVIAPQLQNGNPGLTVEAFVLELCDSSEEPYVKAVDVVEEIYSSVFSRKDLQVQEGEQPVIAFVGKVGQNLELLQRENFDSSEQLRKFLSAGDDQIVVIHARPKVASGGNTRLGLLRDALLKEAFERGVVHRNPIDQHVWITDFPLFKRNSESEPGQDGESGLSATHHPFTSPRMEDIHLLETDPLKVRAEHYDLVVNGVELGGGSARIHDPELQKFILKDIIKIPERRLNQFSHLLKVLGSGCPPHAGIALGFDRLIAILQDTDSVRDVIAFPKNGKGHDLLVGSPGPVTDKELDAYFLKRA